MHTIRKIPQLRQQVALWRNQGERICLVPTMGALHKGHLSLVTQGKVGGSKLVASIFVNPTQFGPAEDFNRYPRKEAQDIAMLATGGADAVFLPAAEDIYPAGFSTSVAVRGPSEGLCGTFRPGHFEGVATVVAKLFNIVTPDTAIFGEKDYQQLMVVKRMVADLDMPVQVIGAPVLREKDGLAMSSRNRYLDASERETAAQLYVVLQRAAHDIRNKKPVPVVLEEGISSLRKAGFEKIDYLELRDSKELYPLTELNKPARLLVAAYLGKTRLIDNIEV